MRELFRHPRLLSASPSERSLNLEDILAETERRLTLHALTQENWNCTRAAQVVGTSRRKLFDKFRCHDLHWPMGRR